MDRDQFEGVYVATRLASRRADAADVLALPPMPSPLLADVRLAAAEAEQAWAAYQRLCRERAFAWLSSRFPEAGG